MENYFLLLDLPFDPPEEDAGKIAEAIARKQSQWSKEMINPLRKDKVREYIAHIPQIKDVMLDSQLRSQEAAAAKKIKSDKLGELEERLAMYRDQGDTLQPSILKQLVRGFGAFGYTEEEILRLFDKGGKESAAEVNQEDILDRSQAHNVKNYLQQLDRKGETLYDFLGMPADASCGELLQKADAIKKKILMKGEKTGMDNAAQALCGLCAIIFKDPPGKQKYDNYVSLTRMSSVNDAVDELALVNQRRIEPKMKERLIDRAVSQYHVSVPEASAYIDNYCAYMGYALAENKILCGLCGAENPVGAVNCVNCGKPLSITCPSCKARNDNSAKVCAKCGFHLEEMDKAVGLLREARQRYAEKSYEEAGRLLEEAKIFWPGHPEIESLENAILAERSRAADLIEAIMGDIQEKSLYAAQTKIDQAKTGGFGVDGAVAARVAIALAEVEAGLARLRTKSGDEAFEAAMALSELVADSEELNQSLKRYPPECCPGVICRQTGGDVMLTWQPSASRGELSYRLVRKENSYPNGPEDGVLLYSGKELVYTDSAIDQNTPYYYAVYVVRLGVNSTAARLEEPVVYIEPVGGVKAIGGNGMVTLSWNRPSGGGQIRLIQYRGSERPADEAVCEPVSGARMDGMRVDGLENGSMYWFAVRVENVLDGRTYASDWTYVSAVPDKPAKPLQEFTVHQEERLFRCGWLQSEWDVLLLWTAKKPDYTVGVVYDVEELLQKYEKIDVKLKSRTEGEFRLDFVGECYIIPGVVNASGVVLNRAACVSSVPCVRDVSFEMNAAGTGMYVNFTWPKEMEHSVLVYRMDCYPTGVEDSYAHRIECSRRQYEANQGILVRNPETGTYYAQLYTYMESEGRRLYSAGIPATFNNQPMRDVLYTFEYKKPGLFHKKTTLSITVEVPDNCVIPAFVIAAKYKGMPLKRGDGEIICTVAENMQIDRHLTFEFEIAPLRAGTRLKLFFLEDQWYQWFRPVCKAGNTI